MNNKSNRKNKAWPYLTLMIIRMEQLPIIPVKWDKIFLRFQSYPQQ